LVKTGGDPDSAAPTDGTNSAAPAARGSGGLKGRGLTGIIPGAYDGRTTAVRRDGCGCGGSKAVVTLWDQFAALRVGQFMDSATKHEIWVIALSTAMLEAPAVAIIALAFLAG
jgi:hypothetical protein